MFAWPGAVADRVFKFCQSPGKREIAVRIRSVLVPFSVMVLYVIDHLGKRSAGEKNLIDASAFHFAGVIVRDRAAAAAENGDISGAFFAQLPNNLGEKFDVSAVVTRDADGGDIFLNGSAHDVADVTVKAKIDYLDAMADEFEVNGVDGAVVSVANRDGGQDTNR